MPDVYAVGASTVYKDGAYCVPQVVVSRTLDESGDQEQLESFGDGVFGCALGVTALPAPPDDNGSAEGVGIEGIGGMPVVMVSGWDTRCAEVAGQLSPGDTALHGTHVDNTKRAVVMCKENLAAIIVGNDMVLTLDRGGEAITITAWGNTLQMTPDSVIISQGGVEGSPMSWIELKGGAVSIVGAVNAGGTTALPLVQSAGLVAAIEALATAMTVIGGSPVTGTALAGALATLGASTAASATKQMTGA